MIQPRIIPALLLKGKGLVKGKIFTGHKYIGDPINTIKIFNDMEVDELIFLDIHATIEERICPIELIQIISDNCLMPFTIGGGVKSINHVHNILENGAEKVCFNTSIIENASVLTESAKTFGSQSIVASIDYKKNWLGKYKVYIHSGRKSTNRHPVELSKQAVELGAGEILLNSIDRDGMRNGYDNELISKVSNSVDVPVIACGGAGSIKDLTNGIKVGQASAVAAGSLFVYYGSRQAVLINYPSKKERLELSNFY